MRKAIVAGAFYPADKEELKEEIKRAFLGNLGPRSMPKKADKTKNKVYGVVAPHAGHMYSGQCAAHAYKAIAEVEQAKTFIMLGTNHTGYVESNFALSSEDFETPLGVAKNDKEFYELLVSKGKGLCGDTSGDKIAHQQEHSIEVQLPFLQFLFDDKFKIVPIICQIKSYKEYADFAKLIFETARKLKRKICVIASSDFTHFGFSYGFVPFSANVKENLYNLDGKAIDLILKFKTREFLDYSSKTTICGAGAISVCIETCKLLGSKNAKLLKYYASGDIVGDYANAVGYASIAFE